MRFPVGSQFQQTTFLALFLRYVSQISILHAIVTTSYLQRVFNMLKHLQKYFENVLQHFCKGFSLKHLQNISGGGCV